MTQAKMVDLDALASAIADLTPRCAYDDRPAVFEYLVYLLCAECGDERECGPDDELPDHVGTLRAAVEELRALRARVAEVVGERDAARWESSEHEKALTAERDTLRREVEELRATLANERGEGEPPREGWRVSLRSHRVRWFLFNERPGRVLDVQQHLSEDCQRLEWHWWDREIDRDGEVVATRAEGIESTARAAMRAASAAGASDA